MSAETWLDDNNRYLAASLQWLRLKLRGLAPALAEAPPPVEASLITRPVAAPATTARHWFGRTQEAPSATLVQLSPALPPPPSPPGTAALDAAEIDAAGARRADTALADPPPALVLLAQRLGLSAFEADTLLLCAACELDPDIGRLIAAAQGPGISPSLATSPNFALVLRLFDDPSWDALSPHRPLRQARLLDISQPGATPLTVAALRADERIVHFLKGLNELDERLAALMVEVTDDAPPLSATQEAVAQALLQQLRAAGPAAPPLVMLVGADGQSQQDIARTVCQALGPYLYRLPLDALPTTRADMAQLACLWQRERALLPLALYVDAEALDGLPGETLTLLRSLLTREMGLVFLALREPITPPTAHCLTMAVAKPSTAEQHDAWLAALRPRLPEDAAAQAAARLASQYQLNSREIAQALQTALASAPAADDTAQMTDPTLPDRLWKACQQATLPRLSLLAQRIDARATWDDLVLGEEAAQLLRQITAQVQQRHRVYQEWGYAQKMNRGLGISALFAGESGTGKTMAAEVIANALDLALYRIDLSAVVSKYIGETEKNLRRLFDAAENGGAILFFDEADALFGKRSEVKDSHDRYANIEINYLLQRMESFSGLAILATNMRAALDPAFLRRLRFVVNFPYPGAKERQQLWQHALLPGVPQQALDTERLARFNLSGGNVSSVALHAAFAAAERGTPVTMPLLLASLRTELRKLDKPVNEGEFR